MANSALHGVRRRESFARIRDEALPQVPVDQLQQLIVGRIRLFRSLLDRGGGAVLQVIAQQLPADAAQRFLR